MLLSVRVESVGGARDVDVFGLPLARLEDVRETLKLLTPVATEHTLIRLGGEGDGGYLVPDDLGGIAACFSPGVSTVSTFEADLVARTGMPCFLADGSVDGPPIDNDRFDFEKRFIGSRGDDRFTGLSEWIDAKWGASAGDLLLQMDIEGGEVDVLIDVERRLLDRFRIVVIELHWLDRVFAKGLVDVWHAILRKLTRNHHVVHLHPNNCCGEVEIGGVSVPRVLEVTLLRKDRVGLVSPHSGFPHPLDRDNVPGRLGLGMQAFWM